MNKHEILHKEIDLIQDCIKRMGLNSFILKGWMLSVSGIILIIIFDKNVINFFPATWVIGVIIFFFWYLDAYFLRIERMYRKLYNWTIENRMQSNENIYNLDPYRFKKNVSSLWSVMWSKTLCFFYFGPLFIIILMNILHFSGAINIATTLVRLEDMTL